MSATTTEPTQRKAPNRARPVVSYTISKPTLRKLAQLRRARKPASKSALLESLIDEAHARAFVL